MIRFNIVGTGYIDTEEQGLAFKTENQHFRFSDISLGRSVEFSVPATPGNRHKLGFGEDPSQYGDMLRRRLPCQMVYDGGASMGTLAVTAYKGDGFSCVFYIEDAEWLRDLQSRKLADFPDIWPKGVLWSWLTTVHDANEANLEEEGEALVRYENGGTGVAFNNWQLVPSVNVAKYISEMLAAVGVSFVTDLEKTYWLVMPTLKGGGTDAVTFTQSTSSTATVSQSQDYFEPYNVRIEWATARVFGAFIGGGASTVQGFRVKQDVKVTFGSVTQGVFFIRWSDRLAQCECLGGHSAAGSDDLSGKTIDLKKGDKVFFADRTGDIIDYDYIIVGGNYIGWKDTLHPVTVTATVARDSDLADGEVWYLRNNQPDMTVFEFLKSVALATGRELTVDASNGIRLARGSYGQKGDIVAIDNVLSVEEVTRCVSPWGNDTHTARVVFDSEDYVTEHIEAAYVVDNDHLEGAKDFKSGFSEGAVGDNGILIEDVDFTASRPKLAAKKATIARAVDNSTYLQRVAVPERVGYYDIAANGTCVRLKMLAGEAAFFALQPSTTFVWRGMAYIWTDAQWSGGVLNLTLQKVSQQ